MNGVNGHTKVLCVIGDPIEHSLSPQIHNTICKHNQCNYVYVPFRVHQNDLESAVKGLKAFNIDGFNVTIPHKQNIIQYLDNVSSEALLMGAVNTVKNIEGILHGYNTDGTGFVKSLKSHGVSVKDKNIIILGAGGASRGIAVKMVMEEAKSITILNRTREHAENICSILNNYSKGIACSDELTEKTFSIYGEMCDIIIQTTPIGMYPNTHDSPISNLSFIRSDTIVCDLIYNPYETVFLKKASKLGCKTINGWGMLVYQAVDAFEIWTGKKVQQDVIHLLHMMDKDL